MILKVVYARLFSKISKCSTLRKNILLTQCQFNVEIKLAKIYRAHKTVTPDKIPQTLTQRFTEEKEIDSIKKKKTRSTFIHISDAHHRRTVQWASG